MPLDTPALDIVGTAAVAGRAAQPNPTPAQQIPAATQAPPQAPEGASPPAAAGTAEPAFDRADERFALAQQWAEAAGVSPEKLEQLAAQFAAAERSALAAAGSAERAAVQELAREWGRDLEANVNAVCDWIDAQACTAGERQALAALTGTAAGCRVAFRLAQGGQQAMTTATGAQQGRAVQTEADKNNYARELIADPRYRDPDNRAYHAHVKREFARLWPGQVETAVSRPSYQR
ncbi:MAG: hypothetical protein WAS73_02900 [Defluviicoccus sp.]